MIKKTIVVAPIFVLIMLTAASVLAQSHSCVKCGCQENVRCVCRPIQTTKYIEITCWDSVCENICLPPRSKCIDGCDKCVNSLGNNELAADSAKGVKIRTSNKLVRKTYLQPIPTVVWVMEYVCENCRCASTPYTTPQNPSEPSIR